jgi:hypothetical protein
LYLRIADNKYICGFLQMVGPDFIVYSMEATNFLHQRAVGTEARRTSSSPCTALLSPHAGRGFFFFWGGAVRPDQPQRLGLPVAKNRRVRYSDRVDDEAAK